MRLSEVQRHLAELEAKYGDLDVVVETSWNFVPVRDVHDYRINGGQLRLAVLSSETR